MQENDKQIRTHAPMRNVVRERRWNAAGASLGNVALGLAAVVSSFVVLATSAVAQEVGPAASGPNVTVPAEDLRAQDSLSGDARPQLGDMGLTFKSKVTQFFQGQAAGDGDGGLKYGGKADLMMRATLASLGSGTACPLPSRAS
jgi:hypothetical protein